ncbi:MULTISPECIES: type II toxin-antitoxin system HicB family antitoxin [Planktothrix]|jgi:predicted RNase H-like HicB family nuclease|uniref:HicB-like antitoxin of toxin-antitoxin system domain-containing protein n=2 Tax=Planktothrix agardhii TaxID=1160 RepID=A0A4P6A4A4_PLAAG|nr:MULTISPECIES: type II toxin-antitoxin system HicB family antitoxin [Planktothrix]BBD52831.1 hypothetical protein NIES204_00880 [Planktothrix agardhii NIES-204]MCB8751146.1 type II toxin-antitoxin system HicB family antitoxin [Planktothrix agardhii 1810]MCB8752240.1 type II toxin-antitoxin system HicB family antitoxin [Planktothrix agardhii 1810]MCB8760007.1 type II toxin-antitoxin system HicB family antitoxin [Planktothrix agardhii 1813]MCB8764212.1 type II toxin-antitoxin system HicB famil
MKITVVLEVSEDGGYTAYVPVLQGCISEGETVEDALENIQEAIALYLEPLTDPIYLYKKRVLLQFSRYSH